MYVPRKAYKNTIRKTKFNVNKLNDWLWKIGEQINLLEQSPE